MRLDTSAVRNYGYRLIAPVEPVAAGQPHPSKVGSAPAGRGLRWLLAVAAVLALAIMLWRWSGLLGSAADAPQGLAVLPLDNLSADAGRAYLVDGLHDELINRLSQIGGLSVLSRTSVLPYRDHQLPLTEIARQLDVSHVLEGSIQIEDDRLRIQLQLVDGTADRLLWGERYERAWNMQSLFAVQSEVARQVAQALQLALSSTAQARLVRLPTENLATYDRYLLGRHHVFELTADDLNVATDLLEQVVVDDPNFAEAWAALGWAYAFQASGYGDAIPAQTYPKALAAAQQALRLAPALADAHSLHADLLSWFVWDWSGAETEYQTTIQLSPDNLAGYAQFQSAMGRHRQALELIKRLTERYPQIGYYRINAAWRYLNARRYDEAIAQAQLARGHADSDTVIGWAKLGQGDVAAALQALERALQNSPDNPVARSSFAVALVRHGELERGRDELTKLLAQADQRYVPATAVAAVYFSLGDADRGFEWLQRAVAERDRGILFLQVDHAYDGYREDRRYRQLVTQLRFPDEGS